MKLQRRRFLHLAAGAAALPALPRFALALDYPTRPVRIVVPYPAGIAPDIVARLVAQALSQRLKQQFVVDLPELKGADLVRSHGVPVRALVAFEGH